MVTSQIRSGVRDFWHFYRRYTNTAVHTASAAALAIFGLLVFLDPWFVLLAIASYVVPPVALFIIRGTKAEGDAGAAPESVRDRSSPVESGSSRSDRSRPGRTGGRNVRDGSSESNTTDGDTDSDADNGDTDSDTDDGDTDSDSGDGDTDTDRPGGDTDSDSDS